MTIGMNGRPLLGTASGQGMLIGLNAMGGDGWTSQFYIPCIILSIYMQYSFKL